MPPTIRSFLLSKIESHTGHEGAWTKVVFSIVLHHVGGLMSDEGACAQKVVGGELYLDSSPNLETQTGIQHAIIAAARELGVMDVRASSAQEDAVGQQGDIQIGMLTI